MAVFKFDFEDETSGFGTPLWQWPERYVSGSGNVSHLHSAAACLEEPEMVG